VGQEGVGAVVDYLMVDSRLGSSLKHAMVLRRHWGWRSSYDGVVGRSFIVSCLRKRNQIQFDEIAIEQPFDMYTGASNNEDY
jgi:hypothetical protein